MIPGPIGISRGDFLNMLETEATESFFVAACLVLAMVLGMCMVTIYECKLMG